MRSVARFSANASSSGWLNFDMPDDGRYIVLPVSLNSTRVNALLDSGVRATALDRSLAHDLGLRALGKFTAVGVSSLATGHWTEGLTVGIGSATVSVPEPTIMDFTALNVATAHPIVAILGHEVFDHLVLDIDFAQRRIAFTDPEASMAPTEAICIPLTQRELGRRAFPISIEGRRPVPAVLDLGSDAALCLSPDYVRRTQLLLGKRTSTSLSVGVEGPEENQIAVVHSATIGSTLIPDVPVEVPGRWTHDVPAIVGIALLSRFRLTIDFGRSQVRMLANQDAATRTFRKDRLGFAALAAKDCLKVIHVSANSPAAKAGLKAGDEITAVDNQTVDRQYLTNRRRHGIRPAGTVLPIVLRTGSKMTVTLGDYF